MNKALLLSAKIVGGIFAVALSALPQAYTISAKPGAVNYIEGNVSLDGQALGASSLKSTFLNAGGLLETQDGKAEVLLTPGVFLRVGGNSRVRMLKPSLIDTQIAIETGESMIEVDQYVKDSHLTISMRGGMTEIEKIGLYRFMADGEPSVAVIDGKAEVSFGEKHTGVGKGHEALLSDELKTREFDKNRDDDLYAWSNIRAQYNASLTYQAAKSAYNSSGGNGGYGSYGGGYGNYNGFGYGGYYGQGWLWSNGFNSWLWMPGGQFFSPFGWGFYGPGYVYGAPVVVVPVAGGTGKPVLPVHPKPVLNMASAGGVMVPVNPRQIPAVGVYVKSPASFAVASTQSARSISASGGLRTASGSPARSGGSSGGGSGGAQSYSGSGGSLGNRGGMSAPAASSSSHASAGGGGGGGSHK